MEDVGGYTICEDKGRRNGLITSQYDYRQLILMILHSIPNIKLLSYVKDMYNVPRFGHSKDSSHFFSSNEEESDDYTMGFIVVFALLMSIAALWFLILIVLRLLGHRVGCASGRPSTIPAESMRDKDGESLQTDETGEFIVMQVDQNRINRTRLIYFVTGVFAIATSGIGLFGIILTHKALGSMYDNFAVSSILLRRLSTVFA